MPHFQYKARSQSGTIESGSLEANDRRQASQRLMEQGLSPLQISELSSKKPSAFSALSGKLKSVTKSEKSRQPAQAESTPGQAPKRERVGLQLLQRLLELHASGLPVGDSIRILSQRLSDPEQKQLATNLWRDLSEGCTFAVALTKQSRYFSSSISYVIEAGEATGSLAPILRKVIDYLQEKEEIRKKMLTSMAYPAFICTIAIGVVIIFLVFLLPQIQSMLSRLGGEMTWSAQLLIDGSDLLLRFGPFLIVGIIIGVIGLQQWRKSDAGRKQSDSWYLRIPLVGKIVYYSDLFQAGNLIATLLESGINTTETLRLTERTIQNLELRQRFHIARNQVNEGLSIAQALKRNQFMPDLAVDILTVGENTGNLAHSMTEITKGFRHELTSRLTRLTQLISSGALVCAFTMVALIAIGIVTSVFAVSKTLSV